jgi:Na+-driven multidrug efflux pump
LAAWIVVRRIFDFAQIAGQGLARSAPALVGQNLGAAKPERASGSVTLIARLVTLIMAVVLGLLMAFAPGVMSLFTDDAETLSTGVRAIRLLGVGYLVFAVNAVFDVAQGGAGDTLSPMIINLVALWAIQVPLAYVLSRVLGLGADGVWLALVLGWGMQLVLMWLRYRQGRWKSKQI